MLPDSNKLTAAYQQEYQSQYEANGIDSAPI